MVIFLLLTIAFLVFTHLLFEHGSERAINNWVALIVSLIQVVVSIAIVFAVIAAFMVIV